MYKTVSKKLGHDDESGFYFSQEMLDGNVTAAVNFDRLQKHPKKGYIIFEYLLCEESQLTVTPYTSHPKKYWNKNKNKFLSLWRAKLDFNATLYLVNYAKKGTAHEDEILLIEVLDMNENGITKEKQKKMKRDEFKEWFINLNRECLENTDAIVRDIYSHKKLAEVGKYVLYYGKHNGESLENIFKNDKQYLDWIIKNKEAHFEIVEIYYEKLKEAGYIDD